MHVNTSGGEVGSEQQPTWLEAVVLLNRDLREGKEAQHISNRKPRNTENAKSGFQRKHPKHCFTKNINNPAALVAGGAVGTCCERSG